MTWLELATIVISVFALGMNAWTTIILRKQRKRDRDARRRTLVDLDRVEAVAALDPRRRA